MIATFSLINYIQYYWCTKNIFFTCTSYVDELHVKYHKANTVYYEQCETDVKILSNLFVDMSKFCSMTDVQYVTALLSALS